MPQGIIVKGIGGFYYVKSNHLLIECKARGVFRKKNIIPMVGDNVEFDIDDSGKGYIIDILPRKNFIIRPPVANIDQAVIVMAATHPSPNLMFIDKLIAFIESKDIDIIICINKIDLDENNEFMNLVDAYKKAGYKVIAASAKQEKGLDELNGVLKDRVSTLAGSSGVGKSTLINKILGINLETGELSSKIERGKHTTRHVELFELKSGGFLLDTPGFSMLELSEINKDQLKYYFREFSELDSQCKFTGCSHINEPDCAVKRAVEQGDIDQGRYDRYKMIYNELKSNSQYK